MSTNPANCPYCQRAEYRRCEMHRAEEYAVEPAHRVDCEACGAEDAAWSDDPYCQSCIDAGRAP